MKVKLRCKWPRRFSKPSGGRLKYGVGKLKDSETKDRFQAAVVEQLRREPAQQGLNEMTHTTNHSICSAAIDVIGRVTRRKSEGWFSEECRKAVLNKKELRLKLLGRNSRANKAAYKIASVQTYRVLRQRKREHLEKIKTLEAHGRYRTIMKTC